MDKPKKPNIPDRGKLDLFDDTKLSIWYTDGKEDVTIYRDSDFLFDDFDFRCPECNDEGCEECESESWNDKDHKSIKSITLQDIIDKIPKGLSPSDIKIKFGASYSDMGPSPRDNVWVEFYYRAPIDLQSELDKYAKERERYKLEMDEYKIAKKKFDQWKLKQDIAEMQAKLDELKEKKDE